GVDDDRRGGALHVRAHRNDAPIAGGIDDLTLRQDELFADRRIPFLHVDAEQRLRFEPSTGLEPRLASLVSRDDQQHPSVDWRGRQPGRDGNLEAQFRGRRRLLRRGRRECRDESGRQREGEGRDAHHWVLRRCTTIANAAAHADYVYREARRTRRTRGAILVSPLELVAAAYIAACSSSRLAVITGLSTSHENPKDLPPAPPPSAPPCEHDPGRPLRI